MGFDAVMGSVSRYIETIYTNSPRITWEELRKRFDERYAGELTAIEAMRSLAKIIEKEGESLTD